MYRKIYFLRDRGSLSSSSLGYLAKNGYQTYNSSTNLENVSAEICELMPDLVLLNLTEDEEWISASILELVKVKYEAPYLIFAHNMKKLSIERILELDVDGIVPSSVSKEAFLIQVEFAIKKFHAAQKNACSPTSSPKKHAVSETGLQSNVFSEEIAASELTRRGGRIRKNFYGDSPNTQIGNRIRGLQKEINERKKTEFFLKRFYSMIEQSSDQVMITDTKGIIEYVNPALCNYTLYEDYEIVGNTPRVFKSGMFDDSFYERLWSTIAQGRTFREEFINKKKNGDIYTVTQVILPLKNSYGKITHFASISRDVTKRKKLEKKLVDIQEEERSRISRELHDGIGQLVTAIKFNFNRIVDKYDVLPEERAEMSGLFDALTNSIREISYDLMPSILKDYGLVTATRRMIQQIQENTSVSIDFNYNNEKKRLSEDMELSLYRILQEALTNAMRYSEASSIQISLQCESNKVYLRIKDNGHGFDSKKIKEIEGQGIRNMEHRTRLMNGAFQIQSSKNGTELEVRAPIKSCEGWLE